MSTFLHPHQSVETPVRPFYPLVEPYNTGYLKVSDIHELYFEESGNPNGKPAIFLHGGPGGGTSPTCRQFFNPDVYRIILLDQRGAGKSRPMACLVDNTTWDLVSDIERLREHLNIEKWLVLGGSWGSTLALAYAIKHPERVTELVLRGIFLVRQKEVDWFYQYGASQIFPDAWEGFLSPIPEEERGNLVAAYHKRLTDESKPEVLAEAARCWSVWEGTTSGLIPTEDRIKRCGEDSFSYTFARIECHYFMNKAWMERDGWLIEKEQIDRIRNIPTVIVQGRYDIVCPVDSAWQLHRQWPEAKLVIIPNAGHTMFESGMRTEMLNATDKFAGLTVAEQ